MGYAAMVAESDQLQDRYLQTGTKTKDIQAILAPRYYRRQAIKFTAQKLPIEEPDRVL
jgi:hypothetical protein